MKKRKTARRRSSRVSGISVKSAFSGLTNIKTLGSAAVAVYGLKSIAEKSTGTDMAILRSKQGAMYEAIAGTAGLFFLKNPIMKGLSLGVMVDGVKKYATGESWDGTPLVDKTAEVAGYPWRPNLDMAGGRAVKNGAMGYAYR